MTKHQSVSKGAFDLSRRSFIVSAGAAGLMFGFGAPGARAAASAYDPSVWYSIGADGLVTVNVGKADMGQHIASTMAQIVAAMNGHLCRCATYLRIIRAIQRAARPAKQVGNITHRTETQSIATPAVVMR